MERSGGTVSVMPLRLSSTSNAWFGAASPPPRRTQRSKRHAVHNYFFSTSAAALRAVTAAGTPA